MQNHDNKGAVTKKPCPHAIVSFAKGGLRITCEACDWYWDLPLKFRAAGRRAGFRASDKRVEPHALAKAVIPAWVKANETINKVEMARAMAQADAVTPLTRPT